jgi:hypothetical protein
LRFPFNYSNTVGLFAALLCFSAFTDFASAQDYRAKVQGLVTDSSGAAVPGANMTLRNTGTGVDTVRTTDETGRYIFDFVQPGTYTITAESTGFGKAVQENLTVVTRGDHTADFSLKIGEIAETITVADSAPQVQFNTTTLSKTIDSKMLAELPVLARNPFSLALLDPAVVNRYGTDRNPFFQLSTTGVDVGGQTSGRNDVMIDGVPIGVGSRGSYSPPMDAVQEFTVQQNSVDAEFGHSAGGIMSLSMKSGTNEFHGTAYYFGRNPSLNAVSNSVTRVPNFVRNHVGGGTLGGPIVKNKLFTFFSYEQWKNKDPKSKLMTLPTELERIGDFSQSFNKSGALRTIYDPWSTILDASGGVTRTPFPGNKIPSARIDSTSARFMQDVWAPNNPGDDITRANNYKIGYPWDLNYKNFSNRTDWNINDKWKMFARYSVIRTRLDNPNYTGSPATTSDNGGLMDALNSAADVVYAHSARTVFNFRMGVVYSEDDYNSEWAKIGEEGMARYWPQNSWYAPYLKDMPAVYYPNLQIGNAQFGKSSTWLYRPRKWSYQGSVSMDRGRHYMKTGVSYRHQYETSQLPNFGVFPFSAALTANTYLAPNTAVSGDPWATFLLGAMDSTTKVNYFSPRSTKMDQYGLYFQDDFKVSRRVTLNLGLRYEYETAPSERNNRLSRNLDLSVPIPEMQAYPPVIPAEVLAYGNMNHKYNGAWNYTDENSSGMYTPPRNLFLPRVGLALRLNDKTALRAGYARYAIPLQAVFAYAWTFPSNDGFGAETNALPVLQGVPQSVLSDPFPVDGNPLILPVGKSRGRYTNLGSSATWVPDTFPAPVNDRMHISIERQFGSALKFDGTYFVNLGHNLPPEGQGGNLGAGRALNMSDPQLAYTYKTALDRTIPNPFYQYLTPELFPGPLRNQRTVTIGSLLKPYPQYGALTEAMMGGIENRYHSIQLRAQRSFDRGFSFLVGYNYNREETGAFFNAPDQYANVLTMIPGSNPRHRISAAGTYELPFGKGRPFLSNVHPIVNGILGGWSTSSIFQWNAGSFLRFGQMIVEGDPRLDDPTREKWFNTAAFRRAEANTPRLNPFQYDGLTGPGFGNLDTTLSKRFRVTERVSLELRMEAYNLTNSFMPANPNVDVNSSLFGRSTNQANRGREFQYTMRLHF